MDNLKISSEIERERLFFLSFIYSLGIFAVSFITSFILFRALSIPYTYSIENPTRFSDITSAIRSVSLSLLPCAAILTVIFITAFTPLGGIISNICILWRGAALGFSLCAISSRAVVQTGRYSAASVLAYFLASVLIIVSASLASFYRNYITGAYSDKNYVYAATLSIKYIKYHLPLAGAVYILSLISIILIHTR